MPDDNVTDVMIIIQSLKLEKKHLKRKLHNIFTLILSAVHFLQSANVVIAILWVK